MEKILIFGGTSEGRELALMCENSELPAYICVAGNYGSGVLGNLKHVKIIEGKKDSADMLSLIKELGISVVYDATHPYAAVVSKNIKSACKKSKIKYLRVRRKTDDFNDCIDGNSINNTSDDISGSVSVSDFSSIYLNRKSKKIYNNIFDFADVIEVPDIESAVEYLKDTQGSILISTGSKEISKYTLLDPKRLYPRVLPSYESIEACTKAGIENSHIIAMQGPFNTELNIAMLNFYKCSYMVSKQSGNRGGFKDKVYACKSTGTKLIIIKAPSEKGGVSIEEALKDIEMMNKAYKKNICKKEKNSDNKRDLTDSIYISVKAAGMGMGAYENMSIETIRCILEADVICGAVRMVDNACKIRGKYNTGRDFDKFVSYKTDEIVTFIKEKIKYKIKEKIKNKECKSAEERTQNIQNYNIEKDVSYNDINIHRYNIVILVSGDSGFYSLAQNLSEYVYRMFDEMVFEYKAGEIDLKTEFNILPGISSISYMSAKCMLSWHDMKIISFHGKDEDIVYEVKNNYKIFALTSGDKTVSRLMRTLTDHGLGKVLVYVGERLSYDDEKITCKYACELTEYNFAKLTSLIILNQGFNNRENENIESKSVISLFGIDDDRFIRDKVPMTKAEIRAVSLSKLCIKPDSICIDIGAGTGSVSIEMALAAYKGKVYAIEKNKEACRLIKENIKKFDLEDSTGDEYSNSCNNPAIEIINSEGYFMLKNFKERFSTLTHAFIGGSSGKLSLIVDKLLEINKNMRIVINAISLETASEIITIFKKYEKAGYSTQIVQVAVTKTKKVAGYTMASALNPVFIGLLHN
ncbi:hypothetical protein HMPREF9333_00531 [Johnsonella ignava ATCC 51276]|uniref:Tetrapyrrole methylase domain-containing protein n=1 Tax=Johnsonella ignava ATCC 51276 TaxID=679200 RepID=G5GG42_9FIRM|nr:precorrin-6Y C5,15-methyltransferase (decarboxylating) subunit CbiT [Johnsonella ignava]EHI56252.1 hypothetical protein HMPREF9333_00531 [Johnsonella ignava ATCC 51276]